MSSSSYSTTTTTTRFSQRKYVVTNQMLFNLGSSIRANILWPFSLSNACRKEIKGKKNSRIYYFMQTMSFLNS
jgi:hypothetical protein